LKSKQLIPIFLPLFSTVFNTVVGISNETPYGVMKFAQASAAFGLPKMISIQNSYSLLVRSDYESGLTEVCSPSNENVGLLAYSPLCGGILTGS
jgi:aryl-alcohol dehydrogenase-like predicted oxidoreductase